MTTIEDFFPSPPACFPLTCSLMCACSALTSGGTWVSNAKPEYAFAVLDIFLNGVG